MAFILICGQHTFQSLLKGYENVTVRCQNCGNFSGRCFKRWEWFTVCFIPLIPLSMKPHHEVGCHVCRFYQDMRYRPDVEQGRGGGGEYQMQPPGGGGAGGGAGPPHQYK